EPAFTQPILYQKIKNRPSVSEVYTRKLIADGTLMPEEGEELRRQFQEKLDLAQREMREGPPGKRGMRAFSGLWQRFQPRYSHDPTPTAVEHAELHPVIERITPLPEGLTVNSKVAELLRRRREVVHAGKGIDWATAEALAFGTLLAEGLSVRLTGQDTRRGTFSQRHATLQDIKTGARYVPRQGLAKRTASFPIFDGL